MLSAVYSSAHLLVAFDLMPVQDRRPRTQYIESFYEESLPVCSDRAPEDLLILEACMVSLCPWSRFHQLQLCTWGAIFGADMRDPAVSSQNSCPIYQKSCPTSELWPAKLPSSSSRSRPARRRRPTRLTRTSTQRLPRPARAVATAGVAIRSTASTSWALRKRSARPSATASARASATRTRPAPATWRRRTASSTDRVSPGRVRTPRWTRKRSARRRARAR